MAETKVKEAKEPLFGKKERKLLVDPLLDNNPITVQVLGVCSALAVTSLLMPSIVMTVAVVFVCGFSNLITSLLRNIIPNEVRLIAQLIIIATLVTIVELSLKYFDYPTYKELSVYIGLIITNCIVMGRLEAFAMGNKPWKSFLDGLGNGVGYGIILIVVAFFRELFGKGTLFGAQILPEGYFANNLMVMPAAAMFILAVFIWIQRSRNKELVDIS
ncbi:MAG: NADH:ubiquinone reductase (Na(+)-transporting) subunit D [Saprospiraceae bacterium]|nr:NADH:ubiquinone reductase (Na(+)-transporting) subunit D [Saprospiraceae bacterium]